MKNHKVKQGETLSLIAKKYKLKDWEAIYNYQENAEFKQKHPNPNLIFPGDVLVIPEKELREEAAQTEQKHTYVLKRPKQFLRIAVEDMMGKRIANTDYELKIQGIILRGKTDSQGLLDEEIPLDAGRGKLKVGKERWDLLIGHLNPVEKSSRDTGKSGVQGRLKNIGYPVGSIDGIIGPKTRAAIEAFQADEKLDPTGELDDETRKKLVKMHGI